MKHQMEIVLLSCAISATLLSGCAAANPPAASGASSDSAVQSEQETLEPSFSSNPASSAPTASPQKDQPTVSPLPQPTEAPEKSSAAPSAGDTFIDGQEYADLSFLTDDQQQLYTTAYEMRFGLYGGSGNLMNLWEYQPITDSEGYPVIVIENYELYNVPYDVFSSRIHEIFTDNCLGTTDYAVKFIDYDGGLATDTWMTNDLVEGTTRQAIEEYPDTYRLVSSTENEVTFTLISHYARGWNRIDNPMDVYIIEYPIRMVNTAAGWRIDEFHTTMYG